MLKVGFFQFNPEFGRVRKNLETVLETLEGVRADIIVLPELPFTGYYFKDRNELANLAEPLDDSSTIDALQRLCRRQQLHLVTGFAEKKVDRENSDQIFNSALLIGPEHVVHTYRKLHLFNTEKDYFDPGDTPLTVSLVGDVRVGMMVCFDWAFPEVARILALKGADIICHPSNLVLTHCQQAMCTRALENGVFTVTANRYGIESRLQGELTFTGQSQITDPLGKRLCTAKPQEECLSVVEIDVSRARDKQLTTKNNLFEDRRPDKYQSLLDP